MKSQGFKNAQSAPSDSVRGVAQSEQGAQEALLPQVEVEPPWEPTVGKPADWVTDEGNQGEFEVLHRERGWAMLWLGTEAYVCDEDELYRPLALEPSESPAETQPTPPWQPEVGKECIYHHKGTDEDYLVFPRAIADGWFWIRVPHAGEGNRGPGMIVRADELRPLPSEPPVMNLEGLRTGLRRIRGLSDNNPLCCCNEIHTIANALLVRLEHVSVVPMER